MSRDRSQLHPEMQAALLKLEAECKRQGLKLLITDCVRTQAEQQSLYDQGRTKPGSVVTNVRFPDSAHNWGVAADFCQNIRGHEYDDTSFFKAVGTIAKKFGLTWGGDWTGFKDMPHLELTKFMPKSSTAWLKKNYGTPEKFRKSWGKAETAPDYAALVCEKLGLAGETREYLDRYRYANDLWRKIWEGLAK